MIELLALFFGCGHIRTLELPMTFPLGEWNW